MADEAGVEGSGARGAPRIVTANRAQLQLRPQDLESLLPADHRARALWMVVDRLDLSRFYAAIQARGSDPGRPAIDPKVLVALWLYATSEGGRGAGGSAHGAAAGRGRPGGPRAGEAGDAGAGGVTRRPGRETGGRGQSQGAGVDDGSRRPGDEDGGRRLSARVQRAARDGGG